MARGRQRPDRKPITRNGRLYQRAPGHLHADGKGYVQVAIVVAERTLGRALKLDERVTWLDRNPFNNAPANLVVFSCEAVIALKERLAS